MELTLIILRHIEYNFDQVFIIVLVFSYYP